MASARGQADVAALTRVPAGEKIAYVRMFSGALRTRDRLPAGKVTAISVFEDGAFVRRETVAAGQIGQLWGLAGVRIGDAIGEAHGAHGRAFSPPTLETVVVPGGGTDRRALRVALDQLAEQDPLIDVRQDGGELSISLYGEVQKEVIQATLAADFGVAVSFRESTTICIERVRGPGAAFELIGEDSNPLLATVGLRVEPAPPGSGIAFRLEVELGPMPPAFFKAVEETLPAALSRGNHGWRVPDCRARRALGPLLPLVGRLGGVPEPPVLEAAACVVEGEIPAAQVHELRRQLPGLTSGEGVLESEFCRYRAS
jgi:ribosomal protection tetracycline resistance protein